MANTFENTVMQSLQIACLTSIRDDGLLSDRQYDELIERISEKNSREAERAKRRRRRKPRFRKKSSRRPH